MKKIFLTLATFAIAGGVCSGLAKFNPPISILKRQGHLGLGKSVNCYLYNNNQTYFKNGQVAYYFYDYSWLVSAYLVANFSFTLTPAGTTAMIQAYLKAGESTSTFIMHWLDKNLTDFDSGYKYSYLNIVETGNGKLNKTFFVASDSDAYSDFEDNLGQAASIIHAETAVYKEGFPLGETTMVFYYKWMPLSSDYFIVNFKSMIPAVRILW